MENTKKTYKIIYKKLNSLRQFKKLLQSVDKKILRWDLEAIKEEYSDRAREGCYINHAASKYIAVSCEHRFGDMNGFEIYDTLELYFKKTGDKDEEGNDIIDYSDLYYPKCVRVN